MTTKTNSLFFFRRKSLMCVLLKHEGCARTGGCNWDGDLMVSK
jgi:hypothetical protein